MRVLADFTPDLEIYSFDEAFLSLAGFDNRLETQARALCTTVLQWTGIPVSVGIAPTKTLAKAVNRMTKKDPTSGGVSIGVEPGPCIGVQKGLWLNIGADQEAEIMQFRRAVHGVGRAWRGHTSVA